MRSDLSTAVVPFPHGLMSSARSPLTMPTTYAREIRNMLMAADGAGTKRNGVAAVGSSLPHGEEIVALTGHMAATGYHLLAGSGAGKIYRLEGASWVPLYSGLNPQGVMRFVSFGGRLIFCNGFDDLMAYDGNGWEVISTFVTDAAAGLTFVSTTSFSIKSSVELYAVGTKVKATLASGSVTAHVASVSLNGEVVTVVLDAAVLNTTLSAVAFAVKPPKAAALAVAHDRLWAFGKGPLKASISGDADRLRVFYTHGVNDFTAWPDTQTGIIPSINLADKAGVADELLAMSVRDGMTIFLGRNHMQLWTGSDPDADGDFGWSKTIPLGVVHGNAVLELPNDLLFITRQGARTLSRTVQTEQLDISDVGGELDPTLGALLERVLAEEALYRRVVPLRNEAQGWLGIALHDVTLVWQAGTFGKGWVLFDGVFGGVAASHTTADGVLYLAKGGQVFRYDTTVWSDAGEPVATRWWLPWLAPANGKRWANKYTEVLAAPGSEVTFSLKRYKDYDQANPTVMEMSAPLEPDFWDEAAWDDALWDSGDTVLPIRRDHVVATTLAFCVESSTTSGPFTLFGLKLYGVAER